MWRRRTRYTKKPHPGRTAVYQFRDRQTGRVLYVGVTNSPQRRFRQHAGADGEARKWWWDHVDPGAVKIEWYPTRAHALAVESKMIRAMRPAGNKVGNPDWESTTTWRPPTTEGVVPRFRGSGAPWTAAVAGWSIPCAAAAGVIEPPAMVILVGVAAGLIATREALRRMTA